ncbi:mediator of RNA polymerase II transcription subunit 18-like [Clytia hemisphaerica]|uniref:Mediator of RNA polymerase II transcription subunit 18 n=1 Tax=Clytia hemisphaerica TaxID=252671 RepID=A0A7M5V7K5_9CNID|eukprot:TCONS_00062514-protein
MNQIKGRNQIQYILVGSVPTGNLKFLLHRLRGLCEEAALQDKYFEDHESVYVMKDSSNSSKNFHLRVRRSLIQSDAPHQLRYLGTSETGDKSRAASMRSCIEVDCTENIRAFLEHIGFQFDHETILRGYLFKKGRMKICVSRLHKIPEKGVFQNAMQMTDSYLVEVTLNTLVQQDSLCEDMKAFAEYLKPIVVLDKLDQKRL